MTTRPLLCEEVCLKRNGELKSNIKKGEQRGLEDYTKWQLSQFCIKLFYSAFSV